MRVPDPKDKDTTDNMLENCGRTQRSLLSTWTKFLLVTLSGQLNNPRSFED